MSRWFWPMDDRADRSAAIRGLNRDRRRASAGRSSDRTARREYTHVIGERVRDEEGRYFVDGDLTIRGTTRPVTLDLDVNGFSPDTFGATPVSFSATTTIDRNDFGVSFNAPIPGPHHDRLPPFRSTPRTSGVPAGSGS
jgi:hypothetical protein